MPVIASRLRIPLSTVQAIDATSAVLWRPEHDRGGLAFLLAHGAGTDFTNPLLRAVGRGLAEHGFPSMVFNFPYAEAGRKRPDPSPRLESVYRDAVVTARATLGPHRPLVLGGRSMGGRMASHVVAAGLRCAGLAFLGYPLHPAGRPDRLRTDHWGALDVPLLFVSGDRDRLCDLDLLNRERGAHLRDVAHRLHVVPGGDHGFGVRKADGRSEAEVLREIVDVVAGWAAGLMPEGPLRDAAPATAVWA